jgi:hypothetical protein
MLCGQRFTDSMHIDTHSIWRRKTCPQEVTETCCLFQSQKRLSGEPLKFPLPKKSWHSSDVLSLKPTSRLPLSIPHSLSVAWVAKPASLPSKLLLRISRLKCRCIVVWWQRTSPRDRDSYYRSRKPPFLVHVEQQPRSRNETMYWWRGFAIPLRIPALFESSTGLSGNGWILFAFI